MRRTVFASVAAGRTGSRTAVPNPPYVASGTGVPFRMQRVLCGVFGTGMRLVRRAVSLHADGAEGPVERRVGMVYLSSVRNRRHDDGKRRKFFRPFVRQVLFVRRVPVLSGDERKKPFKTVCVSARRSPGEEREQGRKQGRSGLFFRPGTRASCNRKKRVFPPDMSRTNRFGPGRHVLHPMSSIRSAGPGAAAS